MTGGGQGSFTVIEEFDAALRQLLDGNVDVLDLEVSERVLGADGRTVEDG